MANEQMEVSGSAGIFGIQSTTITWNSSGRAGYTTAGAWASGTAYTATVFTQISKTLMADMAPSEDNTGERLGDNRRNKRIQMRFSAHLKGSNNASPASPPTIANAVALLAALPMAGDPVTIACANDAQVACSGSADTCLVDECSASETPEGETVIDFVVTKWIGKIFIAVS